jgi:hypothetical protein
MRHAWLWPLEMMERARQGGQEWAELACAVIGGAAWGAVAGTLIHCWACMPISQRVLAKAQENEDTQSLELYLGEFPPKLARLPFLREPVQAAWLEEFQDARKQPLKARVAYA